MPCRVKLRLARCDNMDSGGIGRRQNGGEGIAAKPCSRTGAINIAIDRPEHTRCKSLSIQKKEPLSGQGSENDIVDLDIEMM